MIPSASTHVDLIEHGIEDVKLTVTERSNVSFLARRRLRHLHLVDKCSGDKSAIANALTSLFGANRLTLTRVDRWTNKLENAFIALLQRGVVERLDFESCVPITQKMQSALSIAHRALKCVAVLGNCEFVDSLPPVPFDLHINCYGSDAKDVRPEVTYLASSSIVRGFSTLDASICRLKELDLDEFDVAETADFLRHYRRLEAISFQTFHHEWIPIFKALCNSDLKKLSVCLGDEMLDDHEASVFLSEIVASTNLVSIRIPIFDRAICRTLSECASLQKFTLQDCRVTDPRLLVEFFEKKSKLRKVSLQVELDRDDHISAILSAVPKSVTSLSLFTNNIVPASCLVSVLNERNLQKLKWFTVTRYNHSSLDDISKAIQNNISLRSFAGDFDEPSHNSVFKLMLGCHAGIRWQTRSSSNDVVVNHRNEMCRLRAKAACICLLCARNGGKRFLPRDLVKMIAQELWVTRIDASVWWKDEEKRSQSRKNVSDWKFIIPFTMFAIVVVYKMFDIVYLKKL